METIASLIRRMAPTKGDVAAVAGGATVPFLVGAAPPPGVGFDLHALIGPILMAVASGAGAMVVKALGVGGKAAVAALGAYLRGIVRKWRTDDDPKNDALADGVEAAADTVDPEHKPGTAPNTPPVSSGIGKGPQP